MSDCACDPGTFENGWMETRCASCLDIERQSWAGLMDLARRVSQEIAGRS